MTQIFKKKNSTNLLSCDNYDLNAADTQNALQVFVYTFVQQKRS